MNDTESPTEAVSIEDLCRMCMVMEMSEYYALDDELIKLIFDLIGIEISLDDVNCSLKICKNCFTMLNNFHSFKVNSIEAQTSFEQLLIRNQQQHEENSSYAEEHQIEEEKIRHVPVEDLEIDQTNDDCLEEYLSDYMQETDMKAENRDYESEDTTQEYSVCIETVDESPESNDVSEIIDARKTSRRPAMKANGRDVYQSLLQHCSECGKMIERNRIEGHLNKYHLGIRPFNCDVCNKSFYCRLLLRLHKKSIHTGLTVQCEICLKTFPSARSLYTHNMRHKNENRYSCTFCTRCFNSANSLKRHLATHTGVKEFSCAKCPMHFARRYNLDVHVRTVHEKQKNYMCPIKDCGKRFGYSRLLKEHLQKLHSKLADNKNKNEF